jgi:hypothetical protein
MEESDYAESVAVCGVGWRVSAAPIALVDRVLN